MFATALARGLGGHEIAHAAFVSLVGLGGLGRHGVYDFLGGGGGNERCE